jgi:hypothetical protein
VLNYGERDRLDSVVTETFWSGVDPSHRETEVRHYDGEGRLARKETTGIDVGRNGPASRYTVSIERDARGRPIKISEQHALNTAEYTVFYDDATGHVALVMGPLDRTELEFDESGRVARESFAQIDAQASWSSYAYDSQGFISHECEHLSAEDTCTPAVANVTVELARAVGGTPIELVKTSHGSTSTSTTTIRYTTAGNSVGLEQLHDGTPIPLHFVMDYYGRGEIDGVTEH